MPPPRPPAPASRTVAEPRSGLMVAAPGLVTKRTRGSTRTAMLVSAAELLRERGVAGVTIDAVLARSGCPRGSVYHHFPRGRDQILSEALQFAGAKITTIIEHFPSGDGTHCYAGSSACGVTR